MSRDACPSAPASRSPCPSLPSAAVPSSAFSTSSADFPWLPGQRRINAWQCQPKRESCLHGTDAFGRQGCHRDREIIVLCPPSLPCLSISLGGLYDGCNVRLPVIKTSKSDHVAQAPAFGSARRHHWPRQARGPPWEAALASLGGDTGSMDHVRICTYLMYRNDECDPVSRRPSATASSTHQRVFVPWPTAGAAPRWCKDKTKKRVKWGPKEETRCESQKKCQLRP